MANIPVNVFFYGSFMDLELLRSLGIVPRAYETAELKNWSITFSPLATLVPSKTESVYGIVAELSPTEVEALYSRENLRSYKPVDVTVETKAGKQLLAQCFNSKPASGQHPSRDYLQRVVRAAENLGLPHAYIEKLRQAPTAPQLVRRNGHV